MRASDFIDCQVVRATRDIYSESDDGYSDRRIAAAGDRLIVRGHASGAWDYWVSRWSAHPSDVFSVTRDEIEPEKETA